MLRTSFGGTLFEAVSKQPGKKPQDVLKPLHCVGQMSGQEGEELVRLARMQSHRDKLEFVEV